MYLCVCELQNNNPQEPSLFLPLIGYGVEWGKAKPRWQLLKHAAMCHLWQSPKLVFLSYAINNPRDKTLLKNKTEYDPTYECIKVLVFFLSIAILMGTCATPHLTFLVSFPLPPPATSPALCGLLLTREKPF